MISNIKKALKEKYPESIQAMLSWKYSVPGKFKSFDPATAISLFCDPRGGSTWLAETLSAIPKSFIIDEPLHLNNVEGFKNLNFYWRQYIPEKAQWPQARKVFEDILMGEILNRGLCSRNKAIKLIQAQQLILKIIRGKALLPWYVKQFDFKYKPVMLVRHPFAIAASLLDHSSWGYEFKKFEIPVGPYNEFYKAHADFLYALQTKEEQLTALWCITNNTVLRHPENDHSWITLNYENLVLEPVKHFEMIFEKWNLATPDELSSRILIPSSTTVGKQIIQPKRLLSDWKNKLDEAQINQLQKVLDYFGVDYYGKDAMPLIQANKVHLKNANP